MRPLGIPVMLDRAHQALVKLALEPQWEARFEPNSYGFRPGRSCHDAIEAIFIGVKQEPKFVFDADIKGCFDNISHEALLHKLDAIPTIRRAVKAWLQAGVMKGLDFTPTPAGTPQGGVISPLLANIALHGLEDAVTGCYHHYRYYEKRAKNGKRMSYRFQPILVRYADDFVVLYPTMEGMEVIQHTVEQFLADMGLHLNPKKTRIVHTLDHHNGEPGFDFLGFNIRQYRVGKTHGMKPDGKTPQGFKTLIRPSKDAIRRHIAALRDIIRKHRTAKQDVLIYALNPVITGWTRYYRTGTSTETFRTCEYILYRMLRRWAERRHLTKSKHWVSKRYWRNVGNKWRFGDNRVYIWLHPDTHIQRHYKVRGTASPYDGNLVYWTRRLKQHPLNRTAESQLLQRQRGRCVECRLHFQDGDLWEVDHIDPRGGERITNKQLLHRHCHDRKTVRMGDHRHRGVTAG
jgi:RNA-directed DNA polymerase